MVHIHHPFRGGKGKQSQAGETDPSTETNAARGDRLSLSMPKTLSLSMPNRKVSRISLFVGKIHSLIISTNTKLH